MESQDVGRELMNVEHPLDPPMIDRDRMACLDDPCKFMGREGVGECQADDLLAQTQQSCHQPQSNYGRACQATYDK